MAYIWFFKKNFKIMKSLLKALLYFSFLGIVSCSTKQEKLAEPIFIFKDEIDTTNQKVTLKGYFDSDPLFDKPILNVEIEKGQITSFSIQHSEIPTLSMQTYNRSSNLKSMMYATRKRINTEMVNVDYYPNGQIAGIYKGLPTSDNFIVAEYDTSGNAFKRSNISKGNGLLIRWDEFSNTFDTTFLKDGKVLDKPAENFKTVDSNGGARIPPIKLRK